MAIRATWGHAVAAAKPNAAAEGKASLMTLAV